tara:strand:+ start:172 stop:420 length:249 start_codon:yes stop_codon:yes gene_type:complete
MTYTAHPKSTGNRTAGGRELVAHSDIPADEINSHGQPDPTKWNYAGCRVRDMKTGEFRHTMSNLTDNSAVIRVYTLLDGRTH